MTAETVSQIEKERFQIFVTPDAAARIRSAAGGYNISLGDMVSLLAMNHLPPFIHPNENSGYKDSAITPEGK